MCRHLDLGHDRNASGGGITYDLRYLALSIVAAAVGIEAVPLLGRNRLVREVALRPYLGKQRVFAYLDTPPGIIDQMPMEDVHLQACHLVQQTLDHIHTLKMAALVEHIRAPMVARGVVHLSARITYTLGIRRDNLPQRLESIQKPRRRPRRGRNAAAVKAQDIAFVVFARKALVRNETYVGTVAAHDARLEAALLQHRQQVGLVQRRIVDADRHLARQHRLRTVEACRQGCGYYRRSTRRRSGGVHRHRRQCRRGEQKG